MTTARADPNMQLLVGLFVAGNPSVDLDRLWGLVECANALGERNGVAETLAIIRGPKREQETTISKAMDAENAALRG